MSFMKQYAVFSVSNFATFYIVSIIETMKPSPYTIHYDNLRAWLKQQRENSGLSLRAASAMMGRHHSVLGKMEQDRRKIELSEFIEYCEVIGADPHEGMDVMINSLKTSKLV
ncbi:XRE family transcriptional regulator [Zhongshania marina]|uniref:XRE family transcriptional regulator n=1 Tax=Zhongshania marina TaxID=2304603 RepID=A0ABX9W6R8_9GAMM|nr:XRE family transcriptional regulator [Zhongshania marina]